MTIRAIVLEGLAFLVNIKIKVLIISEIYATDKISVNMEDTVIMIVETYFFKDRLYIRNLNNKIFSKCVRFFFFCKNCIFVSQNKNRKHMNFKNCIPVLFVKDAGIARHFYEKLLGLNVKADFEGVV